MEAISTGNETKRCAATTKAGKPCLGWVVGTSEYCFAHNPEMAAQRAIARSKGGKARQGRNLGIVGDAGMLSIATPGDVLDVIRGAIRDTLTLENSIARGRTIGYLAGQIFKAFEMTELESRISELEARNENDRNAD